MQSAMKISILVPCYNEEKSLRATIKSCLDQTRPFDELVFIDDSSTDRTPEILAEYSDQIIIRRTPHNTGNKSSALEYGCQFITGDVFVTTDADTLLHREFCEETAKTFEDTDTAAMVGYVKSIPHNWVTLCRAFEYVIGQDIHKLAQSYLQYIFIIPGAVSAYRTDIFREFITFDHDTITEDLDFTYKMHRHNFDIKFNSKAICYTQDPVTLGAYINQMRRWFGGGWQNLKKHYSIVFTHPVRAFELSLLYAEGIIFSIAVLIIPFLNVVVWLWIIISVFVTATLFAAYAAYSTRRWAVLLVPIPYILIMHVNAYVYIEQFISVMILGKRNMKWFKPERINTQTV